MDGPGTHQDRTGAPPPGSAGPRCATKAGIRAGGVEKDVTFVEALDDVDEQVDAAYRSKYRRCAASIISHIVSPEVRTATIRLVPRSSELLVQ